MKKPYMILFLFFLWGCSLMSTTNQSNFFYSTPSQEEKEKFRGYISKGYIEFGMTKDDVRASWGEPKTIKHNKTKDYDEVWVYVPHWKFRDKLYFKENMLVGTEPDYSVVSRMNGHGVMP